MYFSQLSFRLLFNDEKPVRDLRANKVPYRPELPSDVRLESWQTVGLSVTWLLASREQTAAARRDLTSQ